MPISPKKVTGIVETPITLAQLQQDYQLGLYTGSTNLATKTDGTRVIVRLRNGKYRSYLVNDWLSNTDPTTLAYLASGGSAGQMPVTKPTTPAGTDNALIVRNIPSGTQTVTASGGFFPVNQNSGLAGAKWSVQVDAVAVNLKVSAYGTVVDQQSFAPASIGAGSAEAIQNLGAVLAVGQRCFYNLHGNVGTTTGAGLFCYVAIKGNTSANYYAVCPPGASVSGVFDVPQAEGLNIVTRNSDAANAHVFSGYFTVLSP